MSEQKWGLAERLFLAAADLVRPERDRFLDEACRGDTELRAEVESLLRADAGSAEFLTSLVESEAVRLLGPPRRKRRKRE